MMCIVFQLRVVLRAQTDSLINTLHEHLGFPLKVAGVDMQVCGRRMFYDTALQCRQVNCNIPRGFNFNFNKLIAITVWLLLPASSSVSKALWSAHKYPLLFINIIKIIYWAWAEDTRKTFSSSLFECNPSGAKTIKDEGKTTICTIVHITANSHIVSFAHFEVIFLILICISFDKTIMVLSVLHCQNYLAYYHSVCHDWSHSPLDRPIHYIHT